MYFNRMMSECNNRNILVIIENFVHGDVNCEKVLVRRYLADFIRQIDARYYFSTHFNID